MAVFTVVQFLEGNFITPRITGSKVSINALAAIIALLLGGKILGIAGMILAVPAIPALRGRWHQLRDNWVTIALFGLIGVAACQLFYFNAVARLSVGVALLLEYLAPVIIVLWLWAASRKRLR